ncbi:hypothetical protein ACFJIX_29965 [Roseateles sp. UC29_93]|uniref:hypothetical protein n=1 Tax=Roseateles sp. UC29_93 TaxID=3350177 RepID=UPI003670C992
MKPSSAPLKVVGRLGGGQRVHATVLVHRQHGADHLRCQRLHGAAQQVHHRRQRAAERDGFQHVALQVIDVGLLVRPCRVLFSHRCSLFAGSIAGSTPVGKNLSATLSATGRGRRR